MTNISFKKGFDSIGAIVRPLSNIRDIGREYGFLICLFISILRCIGRYSMHWKDSLFWTLLHIFICTL